MLLSGGEDNKSDDHLSKLEESVVSLTTTLIELSNFIQDLTPKNSRKTPFKKEEGKSENEDKYDKDDDSNED